MPDRPSPRPIARKIDSVLEGLLITLLAFAPLAFGAVEAWSEMVVVVLAALMACGLAVRQTLADAPRWVWTWLYLPTGLFLLLILIQLIPMPVAWAQFLAPHTVETKTHLLGGELLGGQTTLSYYPYATRHALKLLLVALTVFVVVVNVYRKPEQVWRLLFSVACIGGVLAALALLQGLSGTHKWYWLVEHPYSPRITSGSFVNYSHFCQFMNLSMGVVLALLLSGPISNRTHQWWGSGIAYQAWLDKALVGVLVLIMLAVALSMSRNGVLSFAIAGLFTVVGVGLSRQVGARGWFVAMGPFLGFCLLLVVGFDLVYERMVTVWGQVPERGGRVQIASDILAHWEGFAIWGTGVGTHEVVFPMYDTSQNPVLAAHADNDYVQLFEEAGVTGVLTLILFIALLGQATWKACRKKNAGCMRSGASIGLAAGVLAVLIHSSTDFGQRIPAVSCMTAVVCGLLVVLGRMRVAEDCTGGCDPRALTLRGRIGRWGAAVGVWAVSSWAVLDANAARVAESHWGQALAVESDLIKAGWGAEDQAFIDLIQSTQRAVDAAPGNVHYRFFLSYYRWKAITRFEGVGFSPSETLAPESLPFARMIADELQATRRVGPTYGPAASLEGYLRAFALDEPEAGVPLIQQGDRLAPHDPLASYTAGLAALRRGDMAFAVDRFRRAIQLDGKLYPVVMSLYFERRGGAGLALHLAGDNPNRLMALSRDLAQAEGTSIGPLEAIVVAAVARASAVSLLEAKCAEPDARPNDLALLASSRAEAGAYSEAIALYRRALALDYGQLGWRLALARALRDDGQYRAAMQEARICRRQQLDHAGAIRLIEELSLLVGSE